MAVYVMSAQRTPIGSLGGILSPFTAPQLGSQTLSANLKECRWDPEKVDEVILGQVLTAGSGQAPARQAALGAGLKSSTPCLTINKVCGSGLKAVMLATDSILLGESQSVLAGGQECMSQAPHLLEKSRLGFRLGHAQMTDSLIKDGLWDPYHNFHMGQAAELCVKEFKISREEQDAFARESYERALETQKKGLFREEIVELQGKEGTIHEDEEPKKVRFEKIPGLRPAFDPKGSITAANASKINDGASSLLLVGEKLVREKNLKPIARILGHATHAQDPQWFTTAPAQAIKKLFKKLNLKPEEVDLYEINEAFSVVALVAMKELGLARDRVNVRGGAVALGHPIGASGARILTTLIHTLRQSSLKRGVASLCIGGGEAVALAVEIL